MKKSPSSRLSGRYLAALKGHFEQGPEVNFDASHELGREAVASGLETLDVAKIHDHAMGTLLLADCAPATRADLTKRATDFFNEAILLIEETHRTAREANADMDQLNATLEQRSLDLADSKRELQHQIAERGRAEDALKNSQRNSRQLLEDSRLVEQNLQDMTRKILSATESERKKMSLQLNDEIAQTLLGINIRMLALKNEDAANRANLDDEIATTQRLVNDSANIINQLAHEISSQIESPTD